MRLSDSWLVAFPVWGLALGMAGVLPASAGPWPPEVDEFGAPDARPGAGRERVVDRESAFRPIQQRKTRRGGGP